MRRFAVALGSALALTAAATAVTPAVVAHATTAPPPATPQTISTTDRLADRRFVSSGSRAYEVGTEAGRYPAMGFHTQGEMGGIWSPPVKLLDGIWFGVGQSWIGPAQKFTSGWGYTQMDLPATGGVSATRTDFVPDGRRAVVVGLQLTGGRKSTTINLKVDAHSELMSVYPWGSTTPSQTTFNLPDTSSFDGTHLVFEDKGQSDPNAAPHDWAAVVGATGPSGPLAPATGATGPNFRGPQDPPVICPASPAPTPATPCDDTAYGKGAGGELQYRLTVPAGGLQLWFTVAGSDQGMSAAMSEYQAAAASPAAELAAKVAERQQLSANTQLNLPGDPLLAQGIDWSKQNLADLVQESQNLNIRVTHAGTVYPAPVGTLAQVNFIGAGFPDYPWMFATDGEYTAFAAVGVGQFQSIEDHLRSLMEVSDIANNGSGKVVHETTTDGSVYFGANTDTGDTDETVKFPSAVALVWRWTGDNSFRDQMYNFTVRNLQYVVNTLDPEGDGWPEGSGNEEHGGMGQDAVDSSVYLIRGLLDLAEMAASKGDSPTEHWAFNHAQKLERNFESAWWDMPEAPAYADSLQDPGAHKLFQRYWTGVTPMEAELWSDPIGGHTQPGLAVSSHAIPALDLRETPCFTGTNGLYEGGQGATTAPNPPEPTTSCDGDHAVSSAPDQLTTFTLNTAVMAVAEGNYGRLGPNQQQFYTTANRAVMLPNPDEMPGALEEIAPSPAYGDSLDRKFTERAQVMQAWGNYGLIWPVVHQQLGISPDLGMGSVEVVPQIPTGQPSVAGSNIKLGTGTVAVSASAGAKSFTVTVQLQSVAATLTMGYAVPSGMKVTGAILDGRPVRFTIRASNRGQEVLVTPAGSGPHTLVVTTG